MSSSISVIWRGGQFGTVGWNSIHIFENDTGPDDANHAQQGLFIYNDPQHNFGGQRLTNTRSDANRSDGSPTI